MALHNLSEASRAAGRQIQLGDDESERVPAGHPEGLVAVGRDQWLQPDPRQQGAEDATGVVVVVDDERGTSGIRIGAGRGGLQTCYYYA